MDYHGHSKPTTRSRCLHSLDLESFIERIWYQLIGKTLDIRANWVGKVFGTGCPWRDSFWNVPCDTAVLAGMCSPL